MQQKTQGGLTPPWTMTTAAITPAAGRMMVWLAFVIVTALLACSDATDPAGPGNPVAVGTVIVDPATGALEVGAGMDLAVVVRSTHGDTLTGRPVTWVSSDTLVAKVSSIGRVTAVGAGTAVITASSGGRSGKATITVNATTSAPAITALEPASVAAGTPGFTLTIRGAGFIEDSRLQWNGTVRPTQYVSATELRATIQEADVAAIGTARLQVVNAGSGGGPSNEIEFPIVAQTVPVASVELSQEVAVTAVGNPVLLTATVKDAAGNVLAGRLVTWQSSNALVATVNGSGVVSAGGVGEAVITATSEGRSATLALSVTQTAYHLVFDEADRLAYVDMRLGGAPRVFWQQAYAVSDAHVSPDRRWYVYVVEIGSGRRDIALLDITSRTYLFLTADGTSDQPEWSPDGSRIVFRSARAGRSDIWTMRPDGSDAVNVTAHMPSGWIAQHPTWSPNGTEIAFSGGPSILPETLHVIRPDGTYMRELGTGPGRALEPSWKGDAIAFTLKDAAGRSDIWRISRTGFTPLVRLTDSGLARMPAWSPDGRWIAFVESKTTATPASIRVVRPFGEETRTVTRFDGASDGGFRPAWLVQW